MKNIHPGCKRPLADVFLRKKMSTVHSVGWAPTSLRVSTWYWNIYSSRRRFLWTASSYPSTSLQSFFINEITRGLAGQGSNHLYQQCLPLIEETKLSELAFICVCLHKMISRIQEKMTVCTQLMAVNHTAIGGGSNQISQASSSREPVLSYIFSTCFVPVTTCM